MSEECVNSSRVGFYLLPRPGREPSPPSPRHLQHRLSIINEVSEDSSAASSPLSSPSHKPLRQNRNAEQKNSGKSLKKHGTKEITSEYASGNLLFDETAAFNNSQNSMQGDYENLPGHCDIIIHTSGRGNGYQNKSSQR